MIDFVLNNICLLSIIHFVGEKLFVYKNSKSKSLVIFVVFVGMINLLNVHSLSVLMVLGLVLFIYFYLLFQYESSYINSAIITVLLLLNILLSSILGRMIFIHDSMPYYLLFIGLNVLLAFLVVHLLKSIFEIGLPNFSFLVIFLPVLSIFLALNIGFEFSYYSRRNVIVLIVLGMIVSNYISLYVFSIAAKSFHLKMNLQEQKHQEELLRLRFALVEMNFKRNFNLLHDFLHFGIKLNDLIEQGYLEQAKQEITHMTNDAFTDFNLLYCNSLSLNTVLDTYKDRLKANKIEVRNTIIDDMLDLISVDEQYEIYDFLILKAIEEIEEYGFDSENFISVTSNTRNQKVIFKVVYPIKIYKEIDSSFELKKHKIKLLEQYDSKSKTKSLLLIVESC